MAIILNFARPEHMSAAHYDECIKSLKKAGAHQPAGHSYHACSGTSDKLSVFVV
jgi:hypothetical protein